MKIIPVFVVIPPRVLLLDVAGPMEVLRKAGGKTGDAMRCKRAQFLAPVQ
ncbi:hypothetical protein ACLBWS_11180 [Brucellaceae bacterium D45D]